MYNKNSPHSKQVSDSARLTFLQESIYVMKKLTCIMLNTA